MPDCHRSLTSRKSPKLSEAKRVVRVSSLNHLLAQMVPSGECIFFDHTSLLGCLAGPSVRDAQSLAEPLCFFFWCFFFCFFFYLFFSFFFFFFFYRVNRPLKSSLRSTRDVRESLTRLPIHVKRLAGRTAQGPRPSASTHLIGF